MANVTTQVCDLCPGEAKKRPAAEESLTFALRSTSYQLDVCADHKKDVETQFEALTKAGTKKKAASKKATTVNAGTKSAGTGGADELTADEKKACRAWAKEQGHKTPPRLPASLVEAWRSAGAPQAVAA